VTAVLELAAVSVAGFLAIVGVAALLEAAWAVVTRPWRARRRQSLEYSRPPRAQEQQTMAYRLADLVTRPAADEYQAWRDGTAPTEAITGSPDSG
jgi:hypothetical protein